MRRHPGTFVAGILFIGIGITYVLKGLDLWDVRPGRLWPIALIVVGAVVLFGGRFQADAPGEVTGQTDADDPAEGEAAQPS